MRILHVVHQYEPEFIGGTELYTAMVARRQVGLGHRVSVFVPAIGMESAVEAGVTVRRVVVGERSATQVLWDMVWGERVISAAWERVLDEERPDVVHIQHLMGVPAALPETLVERGIPYVVTLHDYWYGCANAQLLTNDTEEICGGPERFVNCGRCALARVGVNASLLAPAVAPLLGYRQRVLRRVLAGAERVIAPAAFVQEAYGRMGFDVGKVVVIPHGIELPEGVDGAMEDRPERVASEGLEVVYIGGLSPQKGVHLLIGAFNGLPEGAKLTIYGDVTAFPAYVAELERLSAHPGVRLVGRLAHGEIWGVLAAADVAAVPTQWYEAFGLIVSEAFAVHTPVIGSRLGVIGERIRHDVDGWLVAHDDVGAWRAALQMVWDEPERVARWRAGIRPVRSAAEHVGEVMGVYGEIVR